jgi:hypothetical protein
MTTKQKQLDILEDVPFPEQRWLDVFTLVPHPQNYKRHPQDQIENLKADLKRFGQRKPIVVQLIDRMPRIIAGHGLTIAFQQLAKENLQKWGTIWSTLVPAGWTDDDIIGYLAADNETSRGAEDDTELLADILERQQSQGFPIESLGFNSTTYSDLMTSLQKFTPPEQLGRTMVDDLDAFTYGTLRQVVLLFDVADYVTFLDRMTIVREHAGVETNVDTVQAMMEYYITKEGLTVLESASVSGDGKTDN